MKQGIRKTWTAVMSTLMALTLAMPAMATGFETGVSYVTDFTTHAEAVAAAKVVDLQKDEEGMVLLKNTGALPLNKKSKISVFGSQADDFITALSAEGFDVNPTEIGADSYDPDAISKSQAQSLEIYGDVGVITLNRTYGESADAPTALLPNMPEVLSGAYDAEENATYQGDTSGATTFQHDNLYSVKNADGTVTEYKHSLMMTENEERMIAYVKEHCKVVIVAWTGATTFEMSLLQNDDGVDGIVWTNEYGENGATAFAEILSGTVNPSGKTEAIWYSDFTADPTWYNTAWQRQMYGFAGTTLPTSGNFANTMAYGYSLEELDAFPADNDYQAQVGDEATRYPALVRVSDAEAGNEYTIWPAVAGPCTGLSGMFNYGFGYEYRVNLQYDEGIYMGYKYYETAAVDGKLDYDSAVVYPFGFGLSYTDFDWELVDADTSKWNAFMAKTIENGVIDLTSEECQDAVMTFKVKVTNTGKVAGKDVVEVYAHAPYTDGEVEKGDVVLVSFEKTALLQPGQSQVVTLSVNIQDFASFDYNDANSNGQSTYELDAGNGYEIRFQTDSHTIKGGDMVVKLDELTADVIMGYDDYTGNAAENVLSQANIYNSLGWDLDYTKENANGDNVEDFITRVDKDSTGDADMTLMTRASSAYIEGYENIFGGCTNPKYTPVTKEDLIRSDEYFALRNNLDGYDADYPTYADGMTVAEIWKEWKNGSAKTGGDGAHNIVDSVTGEAISGFKGFGVGMWGTSFASTYADEFAEFLASGTINGVDATQVTLDEQAVNVLYCDMFGVDLADAEGAEQWGEFMNQLTWWDVMEVCSNGGSTAAIASIEKVKSNGGDSPREWNGYNWGSMSTMAATWNKELCYTIGVMYGNLGMLKTGNEGADWWGPGGDTHRTPFCGRYNDYFSQDGYHGGMIAAAVVSGAQSRGVSCVFKHIALNDQEASRGGMSTYCTEQACRENYFKIFQIAMQEGGAKATMGSLACIGDIYPNCNYAFAKLLVRDEWGWMGYFTTDGYGGSDTYWPMDLIVRCTTWPLGADALTDNSVQNYLSGSWHVADGTDNKAGVYTGYVDGTDATGSAIGSTYTYETDIAGNDNAVYNLTQYYWSRITAQYVLYTQSTAGTIQNGINLKTFNGEDAIETAQNEEVSLNIAVAEYAQQCGDNATYYVSMGELPAGITCSDDGVISGKATESGTFEATITCRIDNWLNTTRTVKVEVASKFILDDPEQAVSDAQVGVELAGSPCVLYMNNDEDETAYIYAIAEGALPEGITLDETTGTLSGTPAAVGTYTAVISVTPENAQSSNQNMMMGPGMMGTAARTDPIAYYTLTINVQ